MTTSNHLLGTLGVTCAKANGSVPNDDAFSEASKEKWVRRTLFLCECATAKSGKGTGRSGEKANLESDRQDEEGPIPSAALRKKTETPPKLRTTSPLLGEERHMDSCRGSTNSGCRGNAFSPRRPKRIKENCRRKFVNTHSHRCVEKIK